MKGISQYRQERHTRKAIEAAAIARKAKVDRVVKPVVDTAVVLTQINGELFGVTGTHKARKNTMGLSRMFESPEQQAKTDQLELALSVVSTVTAVGSGVYRLGRAVNTARQESKVSRAAKKAAKDFDAAADEALDLSVEV